MSFLEKIKQNTFNARIQQSTQKIDNALKNLVDLIKSRSLQGFNNTSIDLSILNLTKDEAGVLANQPKLLGFKCEIAKEDSPRGYYIADVLKVSWE
jgi:hypothetical protein